MNAVNNCQFRYCKHEVNIAIIPTITAKSNNLRNQELSGAKTELQRGTVGVCSSHRRGGQPFYNLSAAHLRFTPRIRQVCLLVHINK